MLIDLDPVAKLPIGLPVDVVFDRAVVKSAPQLESKGQAQPVRPEQRADAVSSSPVARTPVAVAEDVTPAAWVELPVNRQTDALVPIAKAAGNAMVQIGSYNSAAMAKGAWVQFKAHHDQLVTGFDADIKEANLGDRGVKYRLRFGPLSMSAAAARCEELKQQGAACLVITQ